MSPLFFPRGVTYFEMAGNAVQVGRGLAEGDLLQAGLGLIGLGSNVASLRRLNGLPCFPADMEVLSKRGLVHWDKLRKGDEVASCDENNPFGKIVWKLVEEIFEGRGYIWHVHVKGQVIRSTGGHRFYVWGKGWTPAKLLQPGDKFRSHDGRMVEVEEVVETGVEEPVYNCRIADFHTYFVGGSDWRFSVWAHNANKCFDVGPFNELEPPPGFHRHHVPQTIAGMESVGGFSREAGPAIVIPDWMHRQIQHATLDGYLTTQGGSITTHIADHLGQLQKMGVPQRALDNLRRAISWWVG